MVERVEGTYLRDSGLAGLTAEQAMYDQILGPLLPKTRLPDIRKPKPEEATGEAPEDFSSTLLHRLTDLEQENKGLRHKLAEQIVRNQLLEEVNRQREDLLRRLQEEDQREVMDHLQDENTRLKCQLEEMESFLEDYGLVWVGSQQSEDQSSGSASTVDFESFLRKVDELNALLANEPVQVKVENKQAKLVHAADVAAKITIVFYRNGMRVNEGPFRSTNSDLYTTFVRDIMDGYFPSEFRIQYPEGVVLEVVDKHSVQYHPTSSERTDVETLLRKIPRSVIHNGEVLDLRSDLASKLHTKPRQGSRVTVVPTDYFPDEGESCTVHVKWFDNSVMQLKLTATSTVSTIKEYIQKFVSRTEGASVDFDLYTVYPVKRVNPEISLDLAGCCPQGVLQARK